MTSSHPTNPTSNISLGSLSHNPFIWGNIALIAGVPWLLALSMAGLAVGDPVFPAWFEIFILGFPAIALVTWVQWQQPISPFSLWILAKSPEDLSDRDRQILTLVKQNQNGWYVTGWLATTVAIVMSVVFCKIYIAAPLAQVLAPFPAGLRLFGIVWTEVFFLLSNVLLQAGVSALRIKLTAESELNGLKPFAVEKIKNSFTTIGWRSPQLLKFFEEDAIGENDIPKNDVPPVEAAEQSLEVTPSPDAEELEPNNFIAETEPEAIESPNTPSIDSEQITEESQIETSLEEISPELEQLEPIPLIEDLEVESFSDVDTAPEPDLEEFLIEELQGAEISDVSLDEQIAEEIEDLEISAIVAEESLLEMISVSEMEESAINEPELNLEVADDLLVEEVEITAIATEESVIETISELEISPKTEELNPYESIEESDNDGELESLETAKISEDEVVANPSLTSSYKRELDFLKKSRKTGLSTKKQGFGKSLKRDHNVVSSPEAIESEPIKALEKTTSIQPVVEIESDLALTDAIPEPELLPNIEESSTAEADNANQDFDDELDELVAFNAYVENILEEYLEDADDEIEEVAKIENSDDIPEISASLEMSGQVLVNEESEAEQVPEVIDPSIVFDPTIEAIQEPKDSRYLVQEFLVDKFLARLEELNIADKANKANVDQVTDISSNNEVNEVDEVDEFADLEALLDGKPLTENSQTEDLSDRNS